MGLIAWIKSWFSRAVKLFKELIAEAFSVVKQVMIGQLQEFATQVVMEVAATDLENEEKREMAFKRIKQYAINHGLSASDSIVNTVIEIVYQKIKG